MDAFFYQTPVFRIEEIVNQKLSLGSSEKAAKSAIPYYLSKKRIVSVKRGLYAVVPPGTKPEDLMVDPYLVAFKASKLGVLGYHTALELHGAAYSSFEYFYFITDEKVRPFTYQSRFYQPTKPPLVAVDSHLEVDVINRQGIDVLVTSLPRTYVDVIDRIELGGGWEEAMRSIETMGALNIDRVIEYCLLLNRSSLIGKVGYCLEQRNKVFAPLSEQIERLMAQKPTSPTYVFDRKLGPGKLVKKWNIIVPENVYHKAWEEPNYDV